MQTKPASSVSQQVLSQHPALLSWQGNDNEGGLLGTVAEKRGWMDNNLLNAANTAVYAINILRDAPQLPVVHQTLERLATDTSGDYFRWGGNFTPALKRIENVNNGYYLISYRTKKTSGEAGFQKVDVKLRNPEFRVKAREGYAYGG